MLDLTVFYNEEPIFALNDLLVDRQNLNQDDVDKIKKLHLERLNLEEQYIRKEIHPAGYYTSWTALQFKLQSAWGFKKDISYHKFWDMPGCSCTKQTYALNKHKYNHECGVHKHLATEPKLVT